MRVVLERDVDVYDMDRCICIERCLMCCGKRIYDD